MTIDYQLISKALSNPAWPEYDSECEDAREALRELLKLREAVRAITISSDGYVWGVEEARKLLPECEP